MATDRDDSPALREHFGFVKPDAGGLDVFFCTGKVVAFATPHHKATHPLNPVVTYSDEGALRLRPRRTRNLPAKPRKITNFRHQCGPPPRIIRRKMHARTGQWS